jgi:2-beta-glucuronyltransferase
MRRQVNEDAGISLSILRRGGRIADTRRMAATPSASRRVVFVTSKYWKATSKVGFHFLAQSFARAGWDVLFITTHLSWLAAALGKRRHLARRARAEANRLVEADGVASYAWYTRWQPANLRSRLLNRATMRLFRRYGELALGVEPLVAAADRIIFDSGLELLLLERFKRLAPEAAFVYRVSDDLRHSGIHPTVIQAEDEVAPRFDLVSVPCAYIAERFRGLPRVALQHHGIDKALFDRDYADPYGADNRPRALFVGQHALDLGFLATASAVAPEWTFHVIGPIAGVPRRDNVRAHGEMRFAATIPFIKHADVGLQTLAPHEGAEAFTDSLKIIQYTYCRLPILAPRFLRSRRSNFVFYIPGDRASIGRALDETRRFDRRRVDTAGVRSWDDLADQLGRGAASRRT